MKNKLLFLFFALLMQVSFASHKTILANDQDINALKKVDKKELTVKHGISLQQEKKGMTKKNNRKNTLSDEELQRNFFMRTGLQIIGTFVFIFVLFLVFRMKKK